MMAAESSDTEKDTITVKVVVKELLLPTLEKKKKKKYWKTYLEFLSRWMMLETFSSEQKKNRTSKD